MATYKDYQALANKVYDKDNSVEVYNNPDRPLEKTIWTKVALEKDVQGNATKFLETENPATGYYGAVYTNGKGEYILVNRGSDNLKNYAHDVDMWVNDIVPAEYADAQALMVRAREYVTTNNGSLTIPDIL